VSERALDIAVRAQRSRRRPKPTEETWLGDLAAVLDEDPQRNAHSKVLARLVARRAAGKCKYIDAVITNDRTACRKLAQLEDELSRWEDTVAGISPREVTGSDDRCKRGHHLHVKSQGGVLPTRIAYGTYKNELSKLRVRPLRSVTLRSLRSRPPPVPPSFPSRVAKT
jgi:hypothetical protein